jgi:hypothetical protein
MNMLKNNYIILLSFLAVLFSCENVIYPDLPQVKPVLVIDAWINNKPETQKIRITESSPYFDAGPYNGISGASVIITGTDSLRYQFIESDRPGEYIWQPDTLTHVFGKIGTGYMLSVAIGEDIYTSASILGAVPLIDSISFKYQKATQFMPETYSGEFFSTDLPGPGNCYWIKAYKNGQILNKPAEINIAYDAGFSAGSNVDGIPFIQPIRQKINAMDQDSNGNTLPSFLPGDSVYVEIYSITYLAFTFLTEVSVQTNRPGGFGELFSQPLSNVSTNIISENPLKTAIGFFNVSAVSGLGKRCVEKKQ